MKKILSILLSVAIFATMSTTVFAQDTAPTNQPDKSMEIRIINPLNISIDNLADAVTGIVALASKTSSEAITIVISEGTQEDIDFAQEAESSGASKLDNDVSLFYIPCPNPTGHDYNILVAGGHSKNGSMCDLYDYTFRSCRDCGAESNYGPRYQGSHPKGSSAYNCPN